ncbi:MAG: hypothetical protein JWM45_4082, partial [Pseudonocardiales bacterium]|nr:hypothetical protein [Pseudonocardiales bacterium]
RRTGNRRLTRWGLFKSPQPGPACPPRRPTLRCRSDCAAIDHITWLEHDDMLLHEILARDRMRDDQLRARRERLARRLATARRWQRLARYADQRSSHATERL